MPRREEHRRQGHRASGHKAGPGCPPPCRHSPAPPPSPPPGEAETRRPSACVPPCPPEQGTSLYGKERCSRPDHIVPQPGFRRDTAPLRFPHARATQPAATRSRSAPAPAQVCGRWLCLAPGAMTSLHCAPQGPRGLLAHPTLPQPPADTPPRRDGNQTQTPADGHSPPHGTLLGNDCGTPRSAINNPC